MQRSWQGDEPTRALDVAVQATILELIAELQRELQFDCLFISHDLAVVRQVVVLRDGRVVERGPANDVLSRPRDPYTQWLLASVPVPDPRVQRGPPGARSDRTLSRGTGCRASVRRR